MEKCILPTYYTPRTFSLSRLTLVILQQFITIITFVFLPAFGFHHLSHNLSYQWWLYYPIVNIQSLSFQLTDRLPSVIWLYVFEFDNNKTKLNFFLKCGATVPCSTWAKSNRKLVSQWVPHLLQFLPCVRDRVHVITRKHMTSPLPAVINSLQFLCNF